MSRQNFQEALENAELLERLAAVEHERWAHWQRYVHDQCERRDDGALVIPAGLAARWETQIATPYSGLTDDEKDSDRDQVRRYLPVISEELRRLENRDSNPVER